jgi:hypothetical protein
MRTVFLAALFTGASLSLAAACGGNDSTASTSTGGSGGNGNSTGGTSNTGGSASGGGGSVAGGGGTGGTNIGGGPTGGAGGQGGTSDSFCPPLPPPNGTVCDNIDRWCSWGADERYGCRTAAHCEQNRTWSTYPTDGDANCPAMVNCPSKITDFTCTDAQLGLTCVSDSTGSGGAGGAVPTAYTCAPCNGNLCMVDSSWQSSEIDPACPNAKLPNLGDRCTKEGLDCDYNHCTGDQAMNKTWAHGVAITCKDGRWTMWNTMSFCR